MSSLGIVCLLSSTRYPVPTTTPPPFHRPPHGPQRQVALIDLDQSVQFYCKQGVADSTQRTYRASIKRLHVFCEQYRIHYPPRPPVTEQLLCQFSAFLANQGLALQAIQNLQLSLGLPNPRDSSALPWL